MSGPIILEHMEQGSREWKDARSGRITMSNAQKMLTKGCEGKPSATRQTYLYDVASEIITGVPSESVNTRDMQRGNILEPYALEAYKLKTGHTIKQVGLGYLDEMERVSASPDALIVDQDDTNIGGAEIKCQAPKNHMKTIIEAKNPKKFMAQMQGGMWIFNVNTWDYVSFCPEFETQPLFILSVARDDAMIKELSDSVYLGLEEIDGYLRDADDGELSKDMMSICSDAIEAVDVLIGGHEEIE